MDDASLDDFADTDESESADPAPGADGDVDDSPGPESTDPDGDGAETGDADGTGGAVAPAATTYAWTGSGAACDACGAVVERRWRDGEGGLVCPACKEW